MAVSVPKARGTRSLRTRPLRFHHVAGPVGGCRTCGDTLEVRGLACPACCPPPEKP